MICYVVQSLSDAGSMGEHLELVCVQFDITMLIRDVV